MKAKYFLFLITALALVINACHKDKPVSAPLVGKWYEVKEEIKEVTGGISKPLDTIYTGSVFTANDYIEFDNNGTAVIAAADIFNIGGSIPVKDGSGKPTVSTTYFNFYVDATVLTLNSTTLFNTACCGNVKTETEKIDQLDANTLVLHTNSAPGTIPQMTTETYFTRGH
jgi:hypothetical protein